MALFVPRGETNMTPVNWTLLVQYFPDNRNTHGQSFIVSGVVLCLGFEKLHYDQEEILQKKELKEYSVFR